MSPIAQAVEPLRASAVERARIGGAELAERTLARFAADPSLIEWKREESRNERAIRESFLARIRSLTAVKGGKFTRDEAKVAAFIVDAGERASAQYSAFIRKLEQKVGEHVGATLEGSHVWGFSVLTVAKADGSVEKWKTEQIANVSVLGKVFNQWPSRRMKA